MQEIAVPLDLYCQKHTESMKAEIQLLLSSQFASSFHDWFTFTSVNTVFSLLTLK